MKIQNEDKVHKKQNIKWGMSLIVLGIFSLGFAMYLKVQGYYASGCDAWGHLFKGNLMYESLKEGILYPLYTPLWYNGIQPYRYWAPVPYYFWALLQAVAGGNIENTYYLFAGASLFLGGLPWLLWGKDKGRIGLGCFLGILWFFLPENMRVFFCEGNVPRMMTTIWIPYLVYFIWRFIKKQDNNALYGILAFMVLMTLSHVMLAAMMGIGTFIFLACYGISQKSFKRPMTVLFGMVIGILICGLWLVPALSGGLVGMDQEASASVMASLSYELKVSLNPMNRITGITDTFYYGISIVVISIIGLFLSRNKEKSGYITALFILVATTTSFIPILSKLPLSQLLWMMRFATIAYAFFLWSILEWDQIKSLFCGFLMLILVVDCIPSFNLNRYYTAMQGKADEAFQIGKEITSQRVALLDLSTYGSYPAYALCEGDDGKMYSYGWAWQGASTAPNIVLLNTALEKENYLYLFDRCLELGNDTVLIPKALVGKAGKNEQSLLDEALQSGYTLYATVDEMYIFHQSLAKTFGMTTKYRGMGIGKYANTLQLIYPNFTYGSSLFVEDYSKEELQQYEVIYLSGFEYHDQEKAEALLQEVAQGGTKIIIDAAHMPIDSRIKRMRFLGVVSEDITFENRFSTLKWGNTELIPKDFEEENAIWHTKYIQGIENTLVRTSYFGQDMVVVGTSKNDHLIFVGLNLFYHVLETEDRQVANLLSCLMGIEEGVLPERKIVPLEVTYEKTGLTIKKETTEPVNTTIAFQDNFKSNEPIENHNQLLYVTEESTQIRYSYPYALSGIVVSLGGILSAIVLIFYLRKKNKMLPKSL